VSASTDSTFRAPTATDGEIAAINLESGRRRAWARFAQNPRLPGVAESIVDQERLAAQFLDDLDALDRLERLALEFAREDESFRAHLILADVASTVHRFDDAREHVARADSKGAPRDAIERRRLAIDQAGRVELGAVLAARRRIASASGRLEDFVPLGAVLADLARYAEADSVYRRALHSYDDVSPIPLAWACFQLGMLWGELVPVPDLDLAGLWYQRAITYLPRYIKARVHLAEVYAGRGRFGEAEVLLLPALSSREPEVHWRLADVLIAQKRIGEAEARLEIARAAFEALLARFPLAFADHAAKFYAGSGDDRRRALELADPNHSPGRFVSAVM
jgi:tetratricopeptide (TPR) repeat protein